MPAEYHTRLHRLLVMDNFSEGCTKLFNVDKAARLGANGAQEIKDHPFFEGIDWEKLARKEVKPTFIPSVIVNVAQSKF